MATTFDIIVIGGGISGLGVAREAARGGLRVLLLEKGRCGGGASSGSLRIMHGGFRYLQQLNLPRIIESIRAQDELTREFPELVKPLACIMPLARFGLKSRQPVSAALWLFGTLARRLTGEHKPGRILSRQEAEQQAPLLAGQVPHGALLWWDALLLDHLKLVQRLMIEIFMHAGKIEEGARVLALARKDSAFEVRVSKEGREMGFMSPLVVNTTGAWIDSVRADGVNAAPLNLYWAKAFNVIISRALTSEHGVGMFSEEGRLYFTVPREQGSALGTSYLPFSGSPDQAEVSEAELTGFLDSFNRAFPAARVKRDEVRYVEHGILPTRSSDPLSLKGSAAIRRHGGYVEVVSTKYTTFLTQARKVVAALARQG